MSNDPTTPRARWWRVRLNMWWLTVAFFAIVISYADGFWVTSMQGTVGAIERRQPPFQRWLHDSTLMLPLFFLAVLGAILLARRIVGQHRGALVKYGATAVLIVLFTTALAIAEMSLSSVYDYHLQTQHLELAAHLKHSTAEVTPVKGGCSSTCIFEKATLHTHVRAVLYGSRLLLITNFVLVGWVLALRSDRLWRRSPRTPKSASPVVPENWSVA